MVRRLRINASGCPNACGQHWVGDIGFYGNARKIEGREVPYYLMLLGGTYEQFGIAIQSLPARYAPEAVARVIEHFKENRQDGRIVPQLCHAIKGGDVQEADRGSGEAGRRRCGRRCIRTGATRWRSRCSSAAASARHSNV